MYSILYIELFDEQLARFLAHLVSKFVILCKFHNFVSEIANAHWQQITIDAILHTILISYYIACNNGLSNLHSLNDIQW